MNCHLLSKRTRNHLLQPVNLCSAPEKLEGEVYEGLEQLNTRPVAVNEWCGVSQDRKYNYLYYLKIVLLMTKTVSTIIFLALSLHCFLQAC